MDREYAFLLELERVRGDIRGKFARAHQVLVEREVELLSELLQLEERCRGEVVTKQIEELNHFKDLQLATMKRNENKAFVMQQVRELDARVRRIGEELERERASMKRVELEWDKEFETRLCRIGSIMMNDVMGYREKGDPVLIACTHNDEKSESAGVFCSPHSIAIERLTGNVFICDWGNDRVQVFNKSLKFLFGFSEKMSRPIGICIGHRRVYVTQYWDECLTVYTAEGKFLKSVGKNGNKKLEFKYPRGVAVSTDENKIYVCDCANNRIQCLNLNLTFNAFISDIPHPRDIKLTPKEIVVLVRGEYCIRYYNYLHQLIMEIIPRGEGKQVVTPLHFCLDREGNILMTDWSTHCVGVFSNKGEMLCKFGKEGKGRGEFIKPTGLALDSESRIIVASQNVSHCLQLF